MNATHDTVHGFLRSVLRRAWFVTAIDAARDALWLVSISLLALAGVHVGPMPVPPAAILLVIAVIVLGTLLRILGRRPSLPAAAALADRRFGGNALMTTAVECLPHAPLSGSNAAAVVLQQASHAADAWAPELKRAIHASRRTATTIAFVPLFIALVLLSRPGSEVLNGDDSTTNEQAIVQAGEAEDTAAALAAVRHELIEETTVANPASTTPQPIPGEVDQGADYAEIEADLDGLPGGTAGAAKDSGDLAGDALPGAADASDPVAANLQPGESIDIARAGRAMATTSPGDQAYNDRSNAPPYFAVDALPAAAPDFGDQTTLSPAQAAYAARYLRATGENDE